MIPRPSQSFLIVEIVVLLFLPLIRLLTVDCVTPLMMQSLLMEISLSEQSSSILFLVASPIVNDCLPIIAFRINNYFSREYNQKA